MVKKALEAQRKLFVELDKTFQVFVLIAELAAGSVIVVGAMGLDITSQVIALCGVASILFADVLVKLYRLQKGC